MVGSARRTCYASHMRTLLIPLAALCLWGMIGCDSSRQAPRAPETAPSRPAAVDEPSAVPPIEPNDPNDPNLAFGEPPPPDFLLIIDRYEAHQPARAQVLTAAGDRLKLDTTNVRRLRIDRKKAPLAQRGSIALQLDDQVFEWTADRPIAVFERSQNGRWFLASTEPRDFRGEPNSKP